MSSTKEQLETLLKPYSQEHLIAFWDQLTETERASFAEQIRKIDFELIQSLLDTTESTEKWGELAERSEVPPAITLEDFADRESYQRAVEAGQQAIASGKVAMILVAGGQGSRLGFDHPKGMFPIGPVSNRTLFQIHFEHLQARAQQMDALIPLYLMTSPPTHQETVEFLEANKYFGFPPEAVKLFCQGTMPAVDANGKIILETPSTIFASPDGHGGTVAGLRNSGCLDDMRQRGIEHVFYGQVDNPLLQICHPALIGYHLLAQSEMTSQVVRKTDPLQKVGNVVLVDGQVRIIEYSDLPEKQARMTNPDGSLKLWAGSIAVHVFEVDFLARASENPDSLPFHRAHKKIAHIDLDGNPIKPDAPNAIKFERFIFDLLPSAQNAIICEVDPAEGFCAVKNAPPADSETPQHVKQAIIDLHTNWLTEAGAHVAPGTPIEISPFFAVDREQVKSKIEPGRTFTEPTFLTDAT